MATKTEGATCPKCGKTIVTLLYVSTEKVLSHFFPDGKYDPFYDTENDVVEIRFNCPKCHEMRTRDEETARAVLNGEKPDLGDFDMEDPVLYTLSMEDLFNTADELSIPHDKINAYVVWMARKELEEGLGCWSEVMAIALQDAVAQDEREKGDIYHERKGK